MNKKNLHNPLNPEENIDKKNQNDEEGLKELPNHEEDSQKELLESPDSNIIDIETDEKKEEQFQKIFESILSNKGLLSRIIELIEENNSRSQYKDEAILRMQKKISEYEKDILNSIKATLIRDIILFYDSLTSFRKKFEDQFKLIDGFEYDYKLLEDELLDLLYCQSVERINSDRSQYYDKTLQKVVRTVPTNDHKKNELIVKKIRDGFTWDEKILRKEEIVVMKFDKNCDAESK